MCLYHNVRGKYPLVQGKSRLASSSTSSWDDYTHGKRGFRLPPTLMHTHTHTLMPVHTNMLRPVYRFRRRYQASQEPPNYSFLVSKCTWEAKPLNHPLPALSFPQVSFLFVDFVIYHPKITFPSRL